MMALKPTLYGPDDVLFRVGQEVDSLYIIEYGAIELRMEKVDKRGVKEEPKTLHTFKDEDPFGNVQCYEGGYWVFKAVAINLRPCTSVVN